MDNKTSLNQANNNPFPSSIEIKVESGDNIDWEKAMADLESEAEGTPTPVARASRPSAEEPTARAAEPTPVAPASRPCREEPPAQASEPTPKPTRPLTKYEELCRKPSMTMEREDIKVIGDLSELLAEVSEALNLFEKFQAANPDMLREATVKTCVENLKDTASVMFREFHALRNGRLNKSYDKRCVCTKCKGVFLTQLPDGICDECKASMVPKTAPY